MHTTTVIRRSAAGWQRRTQLPFDRFMAMEKSIAKVTRVPNNISAVYDYWFDRMRNGVVHLKDFTPHQNLERNTSTVTLIDVDGEDPWHYRFASHKGLYFGWMDGKCLSEFPLIPIVDECAIEYFECKSDRRPTAHHIQHNLNGFSRNYLRLLLPLAADDARPVALVSVVRHLALQYPGESSQATRPGSTTP